MNDIGKDLFVIAQGLRVIRSLCIIERRLDLYIHSINRDGHVQKKFLYPREIRILTRRYSHHLIQVRNAFGRQLHS